MLLLVIAAVLYGLGVALGGTAYAILSVRTLNSSRNLATASSWLAFVAVLGALAAIGSVAWTRAFRTGSGAVLDLGAAPAATLLIVIGALMSGLSAPGGSDGGSVVAAVGVGGWMTLTLVVAARHAIREQNAGPERQSDLWLGATAALLVLAIATGLPAPSLRSRALPMAPTSSC